AFTPSHSFVTIINSCKYIQNPFFIFDFHKDIAKFKEILLLPQISASLTSSALQKSPILRKYAIPGK
ncbi:hypothetical protein, partial [Phascolarctobacterium succinatutens]|uniref:hypothetical protein n=1 Tax=Phascolarctobacterium succinatutens TaxID=626940 RepID=UPI003076AC21